MNDTPMDAAFEKLPFGIWHYAHWRYVKDAGIIIDPSAPLCHECAARETSIIITGFSYDDDLCSGCYRNNAWFQAAERDE